MKAKPVLRHRVRADYNENHDEQGRFSTSDSSGGGHQAHATLGAAKTHAKTQSKVSGGMYHVHAHDAKGVKTHVATYERGREVPFNGNRLSNTVAPKGYFKISDKTGTREGVKAAGQAVRASLQGKGPGLAYQGYTIEKSGDNFKVRLPDGTSMESGLAANRETAKKWIDAHLIESRNARARVAERHKPLETNVVKSLNLKPGDVERARAEIRAGRAERAAKVERHTNDFNEMKQNHTGGGTLKAYLAKHMKS